MGYIGVKQFMLDVLYKELEQCKENESKINELIIYLESREVEC